MTAFLKFGGACTYIPKNIKNIEDKLNLSNDITSQYKCECNEMKLIRN